MVQTQAGDSSNPQSQAKLSRKEKNKRHAKQGNDSLAPYTSKRNGESFGLPGKGSRDMRDTPVANSSSILPQSLKNYNATDRAWPTAPPQVLSSRQPTTGKKRKRSPDSQERLAEGTSSAAVGLVSAPDTSRQITGNTSTTSSKRRNKRRRNNEQPPVVTKPETSDLAKAIVQDAIAQIMGNIAIPAAPPVMSSKSSDVADKPKVNGESTGDTTKTDNTRSSSVSQRASPALQQEGSVGQGEGARKKRKKARNKLNLGTSEGSVPSAPSALPVPSGAPDGKESGVDRELAAGTHPQPPEPHKGNFEPASASKSNRQSRASKSTGATPATLPLYTVQSGAAAAVSALRPAAIEPANPPQIGAEMVHDAPSAECSAQSSHTTASTSTLPFSAKPTTKSQISSPEAANLSSHESNVYTATTSKVPSVEVAVQTVPVPPPALLVPTVKSKRSVTVGTQTDPVTVLPVTSNAHTQTLLPSPGVERGTQCSPGIPTPDLHVPNATLAEQVSQHPTKDTLFGKRIRLFDEESDVDLHSFSMPEYDGDDTNHTEDEQEGLYLPNSARPMTPPRRAEPTQPSPTAYSHSALPVQTMSQPTVSAASQQIQPSEAIPAEVIPPINLQPSTVKPVDITPAEKKAKPASTTPSRIQEAILLRSLPSSSTAPAKDPSSDTQIQEEESMETDPIDEESAPTSTASRSQEPAPAEKSLAAPLSLSSVSKTKPGSKQRSKVRPVVEIPIRRTASPASPRKSPAKAARPPLVPNNIIESSTALSNFANSEQRLGPCQVVELGASSSTGIFEGQPSASGASRTPDVPAVDLAIPTRDANSAQVTSSPSSPDDQTEDAQADMIEPSMKPSTPPAEQEVQRNSGPASPQLPSKVLSFLEHVQDDSTDESSSSDSEDAADEGTDDESGQAQRRRRAAARTSSFPRARAVSSSPEPPSDEEEDDMNEDMVEPPHPLPAILAPRVLEPTVPVQIPADSQPSAPPATLPEKWMSLNVQLESQGLLDAISQMTDSEQSSSRQRSTADRASAEPSSSQQSVDRSGSPTMQAIVPAKEEIVNTQASAVQPRSPTPELVEEPALPVLDAAIVDSSQGSVIVTQAHTQDPTDLRVIPHTRSELQISTGISLDSDSEEQTHPQASMSTSPPGLSATGEDVPVSAVAEVDRERDTPLQGEQEAQHTVVSSQAEPREPVPPREAFLAPTSPNKSSLQARPQLYPSLAALTDEMSQPAIAALTVQSSSPGQAESQDELMETQPTHPARMRFADFPGPTPSPIPTGFDTASQIDELMQSSCDEASTQAPLLLSGTSGLTASQETHASGDSSGSDGDIEEQLIVNPRRQLTSSTLVESHGSNLTDNSVAGLTQSQGRTSRSVSREGSYLTEHIPQMELKASVTRQGTVTKAAAVRSSAGGLNFTTTSQTITAKFPVAPIPLVVPRNNTISALTQRYQGKIAERRNSGTIAKTSQPVVKPPVTVTTPAESDDDESDEDSDDDQMVYGRVAGTASGSGRISLAGLK